MDVKDKKLGVLEFEPSQTESESPWFLLPSLEIEQPSLNLKCYDINSYLVVQFIYRIYNPTGGTQLYEFIAFFGVVMLLLSQLPSFHSLRYINMVSLFCCLGYSLCAVGGCIYAG